MTGVSGTYPASRLVSGKKESTPIRLGVQQEGVCFPGGTCPPPVEPSSHSHSRPQVQRTVCARRSSPTLWNSHAASKTSLPGSKDFTYLLSYNRRLRGKSQPCRMQPCWGDQGKASGCHNQTREVWVSGAVGACVCMSGASISHYFIPLR